MNVLFEDKYLIVCEKPVGTLSEDGEGETMPALIREYLNDKNAYIGVVHRLDRGVGGLILYAKDKSVMKGLSQQIQDDSFQKEYLCVAESTPPEKSGIYRDLLFKDSSKNKSYVVKKMRKGVKEASLWYDTLSVSEDKGMPLSLLKIKLQTGRTHQIRVQFASRKMPLIGDGKYGSRNSNTDISLWSYCLCFTHPVTKEPIQITLPPYSAYPWNLFTEFFVDGKI